MRKNIIFKAALIFAIFLVSATTYANTKTWTIDASHTKIQFSVAHMMISSVTGDFKIFEGQAISKGDDFTDCEVEFSADVNSIDTDDEKRDGHLKSPDFLNAKEYPKITFKSKSFKKIADNIYKVTGDFTIRDVTKSKEFDVIYGGTITDPWGNERSGFKLTGRINRFDYNLKWNKLLETGGLMVGKTVTITCNVELIRKKDKP